MIQPPNDTSLLSANQVLVRLKAQYRLIVGTLVVTVLLVALIVLVAPRAYTASTDVFIDYRENDPLSGMRFSAMLDDSYMRTQRELLGSRVVTEKVVDILGLRQTAAFREAELDDGPAKAYEALVRRLHDNTTVSTTTNSRVLTVSYTADAPERARDIANAIVTAFLQVTRDMALLGTTERTEQYRQQLDQLRTAAEGAQAELTRYQQETGLLSMTEAGDAELRRLTDMQASQYDLQTRLAAALSRNHAWQQQLESGVLPQELPDVGRLPQMIEIQARYTDAVRRLTERTVQLGSNHPVVRALTREVEQLAQMQGHEATAIFDAQRADALALATQLDDLNRQIAAQRELVLLRMNQRDQLAALQRQLASADQIYRSALTNYDTLVLAGNITLHNISVLRPAALPTAPSRPKVLQSLLASVFMGLFLGICLALLVEFLQRRLRCVDDLLRTVAQPTLGRIGLPDTRVAEAKP